MANFRLMVVVCCALGCAIGAPNPKTVISAAEVNMEGVVVGSTVAPVYTPPRKSNNPNLYNDIFNIPTSILNAVSRLLNGGANAVMNAGNMHGGGGGGGGVSVAAGGSIGNRNGGAGGLEGGVAVGVGGAGTGGAAAGGFKPMGTGGQANGFFNDIFNIPITALNAVNQLLNNNQKNGKK